MNEKSHEANLTSKRVRDVRFLSAKMNNAWNLPDWKNVEQCSERSKETAFQSNNTSLYKS